MVFDERLHILRRDNTDPVSELFKLALPVERARAGFDTDDQRRQACQFIQQLIAAQTPAEVQLALLIRSMKRGTRSWPDQLSNARKLVMG